MKMYLYNIIRYLSKWGLFAIIAGGLIGSMSALLLYMLEFATNTREANLWIIALLPVSGLAIGLVYYYYGGSVLPGNNLLINEFHQPKKIIPFKMAPLILFSTFITHLFGGSAGREGTAVQIGGAISDQLSRFFKLSTEDRRIIIMMGISAGFASVFGTPIAGAVFALEVVVIGKIRYDAIFPVMLVALIANMSCEAWGATHTHYVLGNVVAMTPLNLCYAVGAGLIFGAVSALFSYCLNFTSKLFKLKIKYAPLRPFVGGIIIAVTIFLIGTSKYTGLGIPIIEESFHSELMPLDFLVKLLFTVVTIASGFKGGEVTPLFFVGATLGNALSLFIPLPMGLLAGMGFVAVFAGATNTPIACTIMGLELFGMDGGVFIAIACIVAYIISGEKGIYSSQLIGIKKLKFDR